MKFYPGDAPVPDSLSSHAFQLRPLLAAHVELDYDAVMENPSYLRSWGQGTWPSDDFTRAENLRDLVQHEHEYLERTAFTYTVLSPKGDRCLGCAYITPIGVRINAEQIPDVHRPDPTSYTADVCFWVRPSTKTEDLDLRLLITLKDWLLRDWQFDHIFFHTSAQDLRQQHIFRDSGLEMIARFIADRPRAGQWALYKLA